MMTGFSSLPPLNSQPDAPLACTVEFRGRGCGAGEGAGLADAEPLVSAVLEKDAPSLLDPRAEGASVADAVSLPLPAAEEGDGGAVGDTLPGALADHAAVALNENDAVSLGDGRSGGGGSTKTTKPSMLWCTVHSYAVKFTLVCAGTANLTTPESASSGATQGAA